MGNRIVIFAASYSPDEGHKLTTVYSHPLEYRNEARLVISTDGVATVRSENSGKTYTACKNWDFAVDTREWLHDIEPEEYFLKSLNGELDE